MECGCWKVLKVVAPGLLTNCWEAMPRTSTAEVSVEVWVLRAARLHEHASWHATLSWDMRSSSCGVDKVQGSRAQRPQREAQWDHATICSWSP